jgi:hypothetical protein
MDEGLASVISIFAAIEIVALIYVVFKVIKFKITKKNFYDFSDYVVVMSMVIPLIFLIISIIYFLTTSIFNYLI